MVIKTPDLTNTADSTVIGKNELTKKTRKVWIDKLRIISMIAVIIIHITGNTIETLGLTGTAGNIFYAIKHLCFFAIGLFIMISGAMFLNRDITIKDMFKKYILKILIALVTFGAVYSAIEIVFIEKNISLKSITTILMNILSGNLWAHMWYLYLILAIYMVTPIVRVITKYIDKMALIYLLGILFLFRFVIVDASYIFNIDIAFNIDVSAFLFYYIYGHFVMNYKVAKEYIYTSYVLGIIASIIILFLTVNNQHMGLINYTSTLVFLCANAIFLFMKNRKEKERKTDKIIISIGKCSFGIYLVHQFFINVIYKLLKFDIILTYPYIGLLIYTIFVAFVSYIVVYLLKKITIINRYLL